MDEKELRQEPMGEESAPAGFPVDLTREEFVAYHMLLTRLSAPLPLRAMQWIFTAIGGLLLVLAVADAILLGPNWMMLGTALFSVAISLVFWLIVPGRIRRKAAKTYDESVAGGHDYYGLMEYTGTHVVKRCDDITTAIPVNASSMFVEGPDCMVWINRERRAIVLPARCMTTEMAAEMRRAADKLPQRNRRFYGRLVPLGQVAVKPEMMQTTLLWEKTIVYTPEEYADQLKDSVTVHYRRRMPVLSIISVAAAFAFGFEEARPWKCLLWFLAIFGMLTVTNFVVPRSRIKSMQEHIPEEQRTLTVALTDRGVRMTQNEQSVTAPWFTLQHIIDRGDYVEFQRPPQLIRVPKRYIEDFEAFDSIITQYWQYKK